MAKAQKTKSKSKNKILKVVAKSTPKKALAAKGKTAAKSAAKPASKSASKFGAKTMAQKATSKSAAKASNKKTAGKSNVVSMDNARTRKTAEKTPAAAKNKLPTLFTPLDDRVLVERSVVSDRTPGGLYIPDSVGPGDRPLQGKVVAVGRGHRDKKGRLRPLDVQLGDLVMFNPHTGSDITIHEEELLVLREQEILAIMKV